MRAHAGGDFGERLRAVVEHSLRDTSQFWTSVSIEGVTLEEEQHDRAIVVELRTSDHPQILYRLRLKVEAYEANDSDPEAWGAYIYKEIMEAVDAAAGLPTTATHAGVITISLSDR